jgi:hypothetical protein
MARAEIPVEALEENLDLDDHQAVLRWLMRRVQRTRQRKKKAA